MVASSARRPVGGCPPVPLAAALVAPVRPVKLERRADSSQRPPPRAARSSRLQARPTNIMNPNMIASPPTHITAPAERRSDSALGAQAGRAGIPAIGLVE